VLHHRYAITILRWLPALVWMTVIFWFSSQSHLPSPPNDLLNMLLKKGAHFGVYGILALCYVLGLQNYAYKRWWALLLVVLYALSDEYHQSWTPLRNPSLIDVMIDSAGAVTALWLMPLLQTSIVRRARNSAADRGQANAGTRA